MIDPQFFMSPLFLPKFLKAYRSHQCLWRVKSKEYSNKRLKNIAYNDLVKVSREIVPDCDVDFVKKKIDMIRGSFRRELKKVRASKSSEAEPSSVYVPKLWYFKHLLFLSDQEDDYSSKSSVCEEYFGLQDESNDEDHDTDEHQSTCQTTTDVPSIVMKKPRLVYEPEKKVFFERPVPTSENKEDELDSFGKYVATQLRNMDEMQNIFAQNVINQVLFQGKLLKLQENTTVFSPTPYDHTALCSTVQSRNSSDRSSP